MHPKVGFIAWKLSQVCSKLLCQVSLNLLLFGPDSFTLCEKAKGRLMFTTEQNELEYLEL